MKNRYSLLILLSSLITLNSCDLFDNSSSSTPSGESNSNSEVLIDPYQVNEQEWIEAFSVEAHKNVTADLTSVLYKDVQSIRQVVEYQIDVKNQDDKASTKMEATAYYQVNIAKFIEQYSVLNDENLIATMASKLNVNPDSLFYQDDKVVRFKVSGSLNEEIYRSDIDSYGFNQTSYSNRYSDFVVTRQIGSSVSNNTHDLYDYASSVNLVQFYEYAIYDENSKTYTIDGSKLPYYINSEVALISGGYSLNDAKITYSFNNKKLVKIEATHLEDETKLLSLTYSNYGSTVADVYDKEVYKCEHYYSDEIMYSDENVHATRCHYCNDLKYTVHKFVGMYCQECDENRKEYIYENLSLPVCPNGKVVLAKDVDFKNLVGIKLSYDEYEVLQSGTTDKIAFYFYGCDLYVITETVYDNYDVTKTYYFYSYSSKEEVHEPIVLQFDNI